MQLTAIIGVFLFLLFLRVRKLEQQNERLEHAIQKLTDQATDKRALPQPPKANSTPLVPKPAMRPSVSPPELVGEWSDDDKRATRQLEKTALSANAQAEDKTVKQQSVPLIKKDALKADNAHFVFSHEKFEAAISFIKANWFYLIAATSLAFSGIFFIQYGIEKGLLPPPLRVLCALLFGGCLIGAGEWLRRKGGDEADDLNAFLPSVFASAGIITLFAAILGARQLYGLISPEMAFGGLIAIAGLAVFIGWHYGALLTLIGLIGAAATPFVIGGESEATHLLYVYFAMITAIGLSVDALKRSAFVSATALGVPTLAAILIFVADKNTAPFFIAYGFLTLLMALFLPFIPQKPSHQSAMVLRHFHKLGPEGRSDFPERLAMGAAAIFMLIALIAGQENAIAFWASILTLFATFAIFTYGLRQSPALDDLAMVLYLAMPALVIIHGAIGGEAAHIYTSAAQLAQNPSSYDISILVGLGIAGALMAAWRSIRNTHFPLLWAIAAACFAPIIAIAIGVYWTPLYLRDHTEWAFHLGAIAIALTYAAFCFQKWFKPEDPRSEFFAFAALAMLGYGVSVIFTETALTLTLAAMTVLTAVLDRRYNMKLLSYGVQLGVAIVSFRLIANPGIFWAWRAPLWELCLAFMGVIALLAACWLSMRSRVRLSAMMTLESGIATLLGIFVSLLLIRYIEFAKLEDIIHAPVSLFAMIWLLSAAAQLYRLKPIALEGQPNIVRVVRITLAILFGLLGALILIAVLTIGNPLTSGRVAGWPIFNSLIIGYLMPALLLGAVAYYFGHLNRNLRLCIAALAIACLVMFIGLEIRHLWHGSKMSSAQIYDGELYSYTIAMLLAGAGFLVTALYRRSDNLRKIGLVIIGLTVAKVFFIDMSGLTGLIRIFSFLILGLALAGLAWLNRWMVLRDASIQSIKDQQQQ